MCLKYIFSHNAVQHDGVVDKQTWNDNHQNTMFS